MNHKSKYIVLSLTVLIFAALAVAALTVTSARAATAYYVDCSAATNGNGSQSSPWNTLTSVNAVTFAAGDQVLFKRGTTCVGTLTPKGSGVSGSPIVYDAYGSGNKPIINGNGATDTILVQNLQYIELRNLEVTNTGAAVARRRGVEFTCSTSVGSVCNHLYAIGLTVRDINGDDVKGQQGSAGIEFTALGSTAPAYNDILVDGNTVYNVNRSGIYFWSENWSGPRNWTNVIVRNNIIHDVGGDGVMVAMTDGVLVENNTCYRANKASSGPNVCFWPWMADNSLFQGNEAYLTYYGNGDGMGFDVDYGTNGTIFQYNYSHENAGGDILFTGITDWGNDNSIIRYNILQNGGRGAFVMYGHVGNTQIYNNTIYSDATIYCSIVWQGGDATFGHSVDVYWKNNIFYILNSAGWSLDPVANNVFDYNIFYGVHTASEPADPHKITADPLLVNPGSGGTGMGTLGGYLLQAGSPAINAGTNVGSMGSRDFFGNAIPQNGAYDIGANEYTGVVITPTPTTDPGYNYIQNPGFETGSLNPWTNWNNSVVASNAHSGTYSMLVGTGSAAGDGEQTVTGLSPNTVYVLQGWLKTSDTSSTGYIGVKDFGGTQINQSSTSTTYTQITINFTTGASSTSATIYCWMPTTSGYTYCDDFSVKVPSGPTPKPTNTPVNTPTPTNTPVNTLTPTNTPVPTNLVGNPGFETGSLSPWLGYGTYSVVNSNAHSGTYSVRLSGSNSSAEQVISVSPNTTYILTGWVKVSKNGNTANIGVKNFGGTEQYLAVTSTSYQQKTITFTTGASNTTATIYCWKSAGSQYAYCDDFSVVRQ